ncbi:hypothetical protein [Burkholderia sp. MSMB1835]|uniref:hypothetical protein n=1 Tax=Burkholderia sp. MSMB1835 TaxID=1637876 RepID=UPI0012E3B7A1|nr:hypothetical protein [Burkholderia sp. MSMB1835]
MKMNRLFHVDVSHLLHPGMTITLGRGQISEFGKKCLRQFKRIGLNTIPKLENVPPTVRLLDEFGYRELYLEIFRTGHPEIVDLETISRLNAFFAVRSIDDAERYIERSKFISNLPIYEVHTNGDVFEADSTWLDQQFPRDFTKSGYYYEKYWKGLEISNDPYLARTEKRGSLIEVLIASDVTIGDLVSRDKK